MSELKRGLTSKEALENFQKFGPNEVRDVSKNSILQILLRQIKSNFIIYLLTISMIFSFLVEKNVTGYTILMIIFVVIILGFVQEYKSDQAIKALKAMIISRNIVLRDGKEVEIESKEIVPRDILILKTGERLPADCVIIEAKELLVNESVLSGESKEISKVSAEKIEDAKECSLLFMGSFIISGKCIAQVIHTGMNTKFGKIADMISKAEKELPLQNQVNEISRYIAIIGITVAVLTGIIVFFQQGTFTTDALISVIILIIAVCVSAFPEAFPIVLTTTLAIGTHRMAKQNAIVNRMSIIETLGETTVICSDKTGTITKGEMTIKNVYVNDKLYTLTGAGYETKGEFTINGRRINPKEDETFLKLLKTATLCNDAAIIKKQEGDEYKVRGSPTEATLLIMSSKAEVFKDDFNDKREEEIPFSSERKMMSTLYKSEDKLNVYSKGALEMMLKKCAYIEKDGKEKTLTEAEKGRILIANSKLTSNSFRTLGLAYKKARSANKDSIEQKLTFLGFVAIEDPPREEVIGSIEICRKAGIKVKMITGDNKETALAIAKQIGLDKGEIIEGSSLDSMTDDELSKNVSNIVIFARVKPEHKLRIVKALKNIGEIVTMTGDGVNDAPALKEAHIGVAMGKNGTDVSRSVADLILKDDHFSTIVTAIGEGRTIFRNIRKFISYQLSCNVAELSLISIGVILAPLFGWPIPLLVAIHIIFMNLVTSDLPAITLGMNHSSPDIMEEAPRKKEKLINRNILMLMSFMGITMLLLTLSSFYISYNLLERSIEYSRTVALVTLIMIEIAAAFSFRSFRKITLHHKRLFVNRYLIIASVVSILLTLLIIYVPFLSKMFETTPIGKLGWLISIGVSMGLIVMIDVVKNINQRKHFWSEDLKTK